MNALAEKLVLYWAYPFVRYALVVGLLVALFSSRAIRPMVESAIQQKQFISDAGHELKTPLTSISGFAEIIRDGIARSDDVQRFAGMIYKESTRLMTLVNDILELSQLDEKQNLGQKESVNLKSLLQGLVDDFALAAKKKNLTIALSECEEQMEIEGYPVLLRVFVVE